MIMDDHNNMLFVGIHFQEKKQESLVTERKVFIIIPNWNGAKNILMCLESVYKINYNNYKVVVVDNNSSDGSPEYIKQKYLKTHIIINNTNLGFAGGCNIGIKYALKHGAEYVWLLNNDTIVEKNSLESLVKAAENQANIGMTGSKIYYYDKKEIIWCAGMKIKWKKGETSAIGWGEKDIGQHEMIREVEALNGCSMLIKKTVCEKVGLMDEEYFIYAEEIDWCVRAKKHGFRCIYVPDSIIYHKVSASSGLEYRVIFQYYNTRNMLQTIRKNLCFPKRDIYILMAIMLKCWNMKKEVIKVILVKIMNMNKLSYNIGSLLGIIDFIMKRGGQRSIDELSNWNKHQ